MTLLNHQRTAQAAFTPGCLLVSLEVCPAVRRRLTRQRLSGFDDLLHLLLLFRRRLLLWALGRAIGPRLPLDLPQTHHLHERQAAAGGVALAL